MALESEESGRFTVERVALGPQQVIIDLLLVKSSSFGLRACLMTLA